MDKKRILIVEDDTGTRELLSLYLKNRGYEVIGVENGTGAVRIVENDLIDLIVLDIEMPTIDGFDVCRKVREHSNIPIIFISSRKGVMDKLKCFELGGDDYITKPFDFAEFGARIKANLRRYEKAQKQPAHRFKYGELVVDLQAFECFIRGAKVALSTKEMQILELLIKHPNQVFSVEHIYDTVWGFESIGDPQTVKVHIKNLRSKIEKNPAKPNYIITVRGFGYRLAQ